MKKTLFFYLLREQLSGLVISLACFSIFVELITISTEQILFFRAGDLDPRSIAYIHILKYPQCLIKALPFSLLFASIYAYSNLAQRNEILSLQALGISLHKIMITVLSLGIISSIICFSLQEFFVVKADLNAALFLENRVNYQRTFYRNWDNPETKDFFYAGTKKSFDQTIDVSPSKEKSESKYIFTAKQAPQKWEFKDVFMLEFDGLQYTKNIVIAEKIVWDQKQKVWRLFDGYSIKINKDKSLQETKFFSQEQRFYSDNIFLYADNNLSPREMTIFDLSKRLSLLSRTNGETETREIKKAIFLRYQKSLSCILFVCVGSFIGLHGKDLFSIFSSLFTTVVIVFLFALFEALSLFFYVSSSLSLSLSLFVPNILFLGVIYICHITNIFYKKETSS